MRILSITALMIASFSSAAFAVGEQEAWAAAAHKCLQSHDVTKGCGVVDNGKGGPTMWCPAKVDTDNARRAVCQTQANAAAHPAPWVAPSKRKH